MTSINMLLTRARIKLQGTIVAKIRLATNATKEVDRKREVKEAQIEDTGAKELEERRATWDISRGQFEKFQSW